MDKKTNNLSTCQLVYSLTISPPPYPSESVPADAQQPLPAGCFLHTNLFSVKAYMVDSCANITIISISHLTGTIDYAAHECRF